MSAELLFTVEETALILNKEPRIIYQWLALGELQGYQRKGRKSRWLIPDSAIRPLLPGTVKDAERLVLDLVGELRALPGDRAPELVRELMIRTADKLSEDPAQAERRLHKKQVCRGAGIEPGDHPGWAVLALHELIAHERQGRLTREVVHRILAENGWVGWYEHVTGELVCMPVSVAADGKRTAERV